MGGVNSFLENIGLSCLEKTGINSCLEHIIPSSDNNTGQDYPTQPAETPHSVSPSSPEGKTYVAIRDYEARSLKELGFSAQETFIILDCSDDNWWKAQSIENNIDGYIPKALIAEFNTLSSKSWFFENCTRREAESTLISSENPEGSFIIRNSQSVVNKFSLSIKGNDSVKHFQIKNDKDGKYFVSIQKSFSAMDNLVEFYKTNKIGTTSIQLGEPCAPIYEPMMIGLAHSTIDKWEVDRNTLQLNNKIGSGNFGEVFDSMWNGKVRVAVKTLKEGTMKPEEFLAEAEVMKTLCHKNLVQLWAVCTLEEPIYIITEFVENGDLQSYLRKKKNTVDHLKYHIRIDIAAQVATGMAFIEMKKYVHRDLAARNVLVAENNVVKVADFGLTRLIDEGFYSTSNTLMPVKWTAPEALTHRMFTIKTDVWSFGILLYEIVTHGDNPYPGLTNPETVDQVKSGYRMEKPECCKELLYEIMLDTWKKDPEERPTFDSIKDKLDTYFTLEDSDYQDGDYANVQN